MKDDEPHDVRQFQVEDSRGWWRTTGNSGKQRKTAGDDGGRRRTTDDDRGRHDVVRPGPWLLLVGQVQKMTGRDDTMPSVLVLAQDGRTAPLRTLY